jgi:hypothetical protein
VEASNYRSGTTPLQPFLDDHMLLTCSDVPQGYTAYQQIVNGKVLHSYLLNTDVQSMCQKPIRPVDYVEFNGYVHFSFPQASTNLGIFSAHFRL